MAASQDARMNAAIASVIPAGKYISLEEEQRTALTGCF